MKQTFYDINILGTGSSGNSVIIDNHIMIDCGIKVKEFTKVFSELDALFVTHRHSDHLSVTVLNWIMRKHPDWLYKNVYMNKESWEYLKEKSSVFSNLDLSQVKIVYSGQKFSIITKKQLYDVHLFELLHDVENQGIILKNENNHLFIYATDTSSMKHCPQIKFHTLLIEGNYDEDKLAEDLASKDYSVSFRASRNLRHYSIQQFENFVKSHKYDNSQIYQMHCSDTFGFLLNEYNIENEVNNE